MTTLDTGKNRGLSGRLADLHCRRVTYKTRTALRCKLCGSILASVVAHFEACHRAEFEHEGGRL